MTTLLAPQVQRLPRQPRASVGLLRLGSRVVPITFSAWLWALLAVAIDDAIGLAMIDVGAVLFYSVLVIGVAMRVVGSPRLATPSDRWEASVRFWTLPCRAIGALCRRLGSFGLLLIAGWHLRIVGAGLVAAYTYSPEGHQAASHSYGWCLLAITALTYVGPVCDRLLPVVMARSLARARHEGMV